MQHRDMDVLSPYVLQSMRFLVFKHKEGARVLYVVLRTSMNRESCVDNIGSGGLFASVDVATGRVDSNAFAEYIGGMTADNITDDMAEAITIGRQRHPLTGTKFVGFEIPCFDEAKKLVLEIADNVDFWGRRWLAFDVAISERGPAIVEINVDRPGTDVDWQICHKDTPLRPVLEEMIRED